MRGKNQLFIKQHSSLPSRNPLHGCSILYAKCTSTYTPTHTFSSQHLSLAALLRGLVKLITCSDIHCAWTSDARTCHGVEEWHKALEQLSELRNVTNVDRIVVAIGSMLTHVWTKDCLAAFLKMCLSRVLPDLPPH